MAWQSTPKQIITTKINFMISPDLQVLTSCFGL